MNITETIAPTSYCLALPDVKKHLNVDHENDDSYISDLIEFVHDYAKRICNRAIISSTWAYCLDQFPTKNSGLILLPRGKVSSVTSVKYYDDDGALNTIASTNYQTVLAKVPAEIVPVSGYYWPVAGDRLAAVEITYVAGWAASAVPASLKRAMLLHINHLYDVRAPVILGTNYSKMPFSMSSLYSIFRLPGLPDA